MAHSYVFADGAWFNGYVITAADWSALDTSLFGAVNGDGGGNWTPSADIDVGGAGLWLAGPSTLENGANVDGATGTDITLGSNDYPQLVNSHPGATRTLRSSCLGAMSPFGFIVVASSNSAQLMSVTPGARASIPLRVHQSGTLQSVVLTFFVGAPHTAVPTQLPGLRICQRDALGNVTPLGTGDANGFVYPTTPGSGTAWYASGGPQTLTYTLTGGGALIDRTAYSYFAEIVDESGVGSKPRNVYGDLLATFINISDCRPS